MHLARIVYCFQEKKSNLNIGISKFCALRAKSCVMAGSKMIHSVCVCSTHQHVRVLVDAMNWDLIYKNLIKKIVYNPDSNKCIMHQCKSCSGTATLEEFLYQELNEHEDDEKFNYCQWDTTIDQYWQPLQSLTNNTKKLWLMLLTIWQDISISQS